MANKKSEISKVARLCSILFALCKSENIPAQSLATFLNISLRSVYRDIANLQKYGYEIASSTGPDGGYVLMNKINMTTEQVVVAGNELEKKNVDIDLTDEQLRTAVKMDLMSKISRSIFNTNTIDSDKIADNQLKGDFEKLKNRLYFDTTEWYWENKLDKMMLHVVEAIADQRIIEIKYIERRNAGEKKAQAEPYGLVWKGGNWYLIAATNDEIQRIRTSRIKEIRYTEETFQYPKELNIESWWKKDLMDFGCGNIEVILEAYGDAIPEMMELTTKPENIRKMENGVLTMIMHVDNYDWLVPIIMSYAGKVYPVAPIELNERIAKLVAIMRQQYQDVDVKEIGNEIEFDINNDARQRIARKTDE